MAQNKSGNEKSFQNSLRDNNTIYQGGHVVSGSGHNPNFYYGPVDQRHLASDASKDLPASGRTNSVENSVSEAQKARGGTQPLQQVWRVRGVPTEFDKAMLADVLRRHFYDNEINVKTLAPDLRQNQVATVRFAHLPDRLRALANGDQLTIDIPALPGFTPGSNVRLAIDRHFCGITVLFSPPTGDHNVDVLVVHGLGGHPYGSFVHKPDGHMWLSDSLPQDMRTARVMTYGYHSGFHGSTSFAGLDDLAGSLRLEIRRLLRSGEQNLILVGHSLGGLLIKGALVQLAKSNPELDQIKRVLGALFFGVPNNGMDIESLIPMVSDQPNRLLLESLSAINSQVLRLQRESFATLLGQTLFEIFCFYETRLSPTAIQDDEGRWKMGGPLRCLVTPESATSCLPSDIRSDHSAELPRTHSELVKFAYQDPEYEKVCEVLCQMHQDSARAPKAAGILRSEHHYAVPFEKVYTYVHRDEISAELDQKLQIRHEKASVPYAVSLHGLGGAGKSQLALDYAEKHKARYNPVLWIDATDEEAARSSFKRCAAELGLPDERGERQQSIFTDSVVQGVIRWLRDRAEGDEEWLVIVDNADDVSWGTQKIMPKGPQGTIIITSRDERSVKLVHGACEHIRVDTMSPLEGATLLLQHLQLDPESVSEGTRHNCDKVAQRLGYLALAIGLAGAYIGEDARPEQALSQYLEDYDNHRDELLQMDGFHGLLPTEKTVWTVWDTTFKKITTEHSRVRPELLLTFLAQFKGTIIQDEMFRLASLGMEALDHNLDARADGGMPADLRQFFALSDGKWDSFRYRQSRDVLVRYGLLQRVDGQWPGVTMHSLVQWRAIQDEAKRPWGWLYLQFVLAASWQMTQGGEQPEFHRHLMVHLPDINEIEAKYESPRRHMDFVNTIIGYVYEGEGRWEEAGKLLAKALETCKSRLGTDHIATLERMNGLAWVYLQQSRWDEAENLQVEAVDTSKALFGGSHERTLRYMGNLALIYRDHGRWQEAEQLQVQVMGSFKSIFRAGHPDILRSMSNLACTYQGQDRWLEAEQLQVEVLEFSEASLSADHAAILLIRGDLATTYRQLGRLQEAERLQEQVMETRKTKFGADHPSTLNSMACLALTFYKQRRLDDAEQLGAKVFSIMKAKLGTDHPNTLRAMGNLALTWRRQGRHVNAMKLMESCLKAMQRVLGPEHRHTLWFVSTLELWRRETE